jgi:hypothetical protein
VDFCKAFDSVSRATILSILRLYNVPAETIDGIGSMYNGTSAFVRTSVGPSSLFSTSTGVLQGDTLAPFLFVIVIDYVLRHAFPNDDLGIELSRRRSSRHPAVRLSVLAYADDIALLSRSIPDAQVMLERLESYAASVGLHINTGKTKALHINIAPGTSQLHTREGPIDWVSSFTYLGATIPDMHKDFLERKAKAWSAMHRLTTVWTSNASITLKGRLFRSLVEPVLLYGAESWALSPTAEKKVDEAHAHMLRCALGKQWPDRTKTAELYTLAGVVKLSSRLREVRERIVLESALRIERGNQQPLDLVLLWRPTEKFSRGKHRQFTFLNRLEEDALESSMTITEWIVALKEAAKDKDKECS